MAFVFNDNLQSYSVGSGYPTGFQGNGVIFNHFFENGSASPTPSPVGFYENAGIYFQFAGDALSYPVSGNLGSSAVSNTTVAWWGWGQDPQFPPGGLQLTSQNPSLSTNVFNLLTVQFEVDNSVTFKAPGATSVNSQAQVFDYFTWTFFSLSAAFGVTVVGGVTVCTVTVSFAVNGVVVLSGHTFITTVPEASLWNMISGINQWNFPSAFYGYLAATDTALALPFYPAPSGTINAKAPQLVAEFANLPTPPQAWVPQLVVEIIIAGFVGGGVFPEYIKSRARPGH